jgi:hypothetical protein
MVSERTNSPSKFFRLFLCFFRYLWVSPNTFLGLLFCPFVLLGGDIRVVDGVVEICGPGIAWLLGKLTKENIVALTLGHVVIGKSRRALVQTRSHERVHVHQYERWGPLFIPLYFLASIVAVVRGRNYYHGNAFEIAASKEHLDEKSV